MNPKYTIVACVAALAAVSSTFAQSTVGILDPNPNSLSIQNSPNNVGNASFVTLSTMSSLIATAFANNTGGVINFDPANGWTGASLTSANITYGTSQANSLTMSLGTGSTPTAFATSTASSTPTSGTGVMIFSGGQGNPTAVLSFSQGLSDFGITQLSRGGSANTLTMSFTLQDNTVVNYVADTSVNTTVNFYGYQAPANDPIKSVTLSAGNFFRFDDLAFVAAPVPEPATMALTGIGGLAMLFAFRRRSA